MLQQEHYPLALLLLQAVFKMPPVEAVRLIKIGKSVLESWHNTYMQVREKIEVSGRDARWEFSKPMLFERTNYMAEICSDLSEMVEIVDDFHKFLGPELKAVTGDTQVIPIICHAITDDSSAYCLSVRSAAKDCCLMHAPALKATMKELFVYVAL